jgi:hypothetical protein
MDDLNLLYSRFSVRFLVDFRYEKRTERPGPSGMVHPRKQGQCLFKWKEGVETGPSLGIGSCDIGNIVSGSGEVFGDEFDLGSSEAGEI